MRALVHKYKWLIIGYLTVEVVVSALSFKQLLHQAILLLAHYGMSSQLQSQLYSLLK